MATSSEQRSPGKRYVDFDEYVALQLQKARSGIKSTDLLRALIGVATVLLAYVLLFVIAEHWILPDGIGPWPRMIMLAVMLTGCAAWIVFKVVRPYMRRVSDLYAAKVLEQSEPRLSSNLLNLVDIQRAGRQSSPAVRTAMEKHAATRLAEINVEEAIDHRPLLRLSYVMLAVVVLSCLYAVFSPKRVSSSIWRALAPFSDLQVATRTSIVDVKPGDATVLARTQLEVIADIAGETPESVTLLFTTADKRHEAEPVTLRETDEGMKRYRGIISGENGRGVLQDFTYSIQAGDARTRDFRITVIQPPSANVDSVHYAYPSYMRLEPRTSTGGHIDAWEGTEVTLLGQSNRPVVSAMVASSDDDQGSKAEEVPMQVTNGTELRAQWRLSYRSDGTYPRFYRILCRTSQGETDPAPTVYNVTIRPDQPPEIILREPTRDLQMPANGIVPLLIEARDPDFALRFINLRVEKDGEQVYSVPLFDGEQRAVRLRHDFELEPLNLRAGDVIRYWVEARDNKLPLGNGRNTPKMNITISEPIPEEQVQRQLEEEKRRQSERLEQDREQKGDPEAAPDDKGDKHAAQEEFPPPGDQNRQPSDEQRRSDPSGEQQVAEGSSPPEDSEARQQQERLSPDGPDDDEVLRKLIEREQQEQEQRQQEQQEKQQEQQQGSDDGSSDGSSQSRAGGDEQQSSDETQQQDGQPKAGDQGAGERKQQPNSASPQQPSDQSDRADKSASGGTGQQRDQSASPRGENDQGQSGQPDSAESEKDSGGGNEAGAGENSAAENGNADQGSSAPPQSTTPTGDNAANRAKSPGSESNPEAGSQTDQHDPSAQEEPSPDSPDAVHKPATGDETGTATPEHDPKHDPVTAKNDIQRKPGTEPATRPRQSDNADRPPGKADPNSPQDGAGDPTGRPEQGQPDSRQDPRARQSPDDPSRSQPSDRLAPTGSQPSPDQSPESGRPSDPSKPGQDQQSANDSQSGNKPDGSSEDGKPGAAEPGQSGSRGDKTSPSGENQSQDGGEPGAAGDAPSDDAPAGSSTDPSDSKATPGKPGDAPGRGSQGGAGRRDPRKRDGSPGGTSPERSNDPSGGEGGGLSEAEEANPEFAREAANLVLRKLEEDIQRRDVDSKLLEELGWTEDELRRFSERLKRQLEAPSGDQTPEQLARQRQFEETLKQLDLRGTAGARSGGGDRYSERAADSFAPRQNRPPAEYQEAWEAFRKRVSRQADVRNE